MDTTPGALVEELELSELERLIMDALAASAAVAGCAAVIATVSDPIQLFRMLI